MTDFRSLCSLLLCAAMLAGLLSGCGTGTESTPAVSSETAAEAVTTDEEILKAIELGFVPERLQSNYEVLISYSDFCSILDNFITTLFPEAMDSWKQASAKYHDAGDNMSRMEGALVLLYAAQCCGVDHVGYEYNIPLEDFIADGVNFMEGVSWNYPLLPDMYNQPYYNETIANSEHYAWRCTLDYAENAKRFVQYFSYGNGKTFFDYDEHFSQNLGGVFTRGDAIRTVERLYENVRFTQFVPADTVSCTVSADAIATGTAMPEASWQQLPDWKGHTVPPGNWTAGYGGSMQYQKEFIEVLGRQGFNFVRVPLDSRMIFNGSDMSMVNPAYLETMDDLIDYCAENGIHVCFDLHDMPGFYTGGDDSQITLWHEEETQELFVQFWRFMAEYYKDVPTNLLSFNLLNEPHGMNDEPSDALYSEIMLRAIEAIRETTPDRLIFVDALRVVMGTPVQGLADAQIVQTIHPYFLQNGVQQWPSYTINGFVHKDLGELILKGDFPAGTTITATINGVHAQSTFSIKADGNTIAGLELGTEAVGENGCTNIEEEGTGGECRFYKGVPLTAELPEDCNQIKLVQENGWWYSISNLTLETGDYTITLTAFNNVVTDGTVPVLTIHENGTVSAKRDSTLAWMSKEWLDERFQSYQKFTEETGNLIMVQEFGFNETIAYPATLAAADDFLSVLEKYDIPWCSWCGNFGPILDKRDHELTLLWENIDMKRNGAEYEMVSENYMVDTGLMEVFRKYMN